MKKFLGYILALTMVLTLLSPVTLGSAAEKSDDIVILYTNDIHCATGDEESFGYANLAAYKKEMQEKYNYVSLVDAGDAIQGEKLGVLSSGEFLVKIMNAAGYDLATFGNHEFDYTVPQLLNVIVKDADYEYISCNFKDLTTGNTVVKPYKIMQYGDKKVAFIGITTPETFSKSTPAYFKDKAGKYIYSFCEGNNGQDLYNEVQANIDAVKKEGADYVVALAHLGVDQASSPWTSTEVVKNTKGLDVVIDGHSHSTVPSSTVEDAAGSDVLVTQTGTKFSSNIDGTATPAFGKLTIAKDGTITSGLVMDTEANKKDADVSKIITDINSEFNDMLQEIIATTDYPLYINDPKTGNRMIRSQETNLGDLISDAYRIVSGADIGTVNGGGIRIDIPKGDITVDTLIAAHPFGNELCVVEATGKQIADMLEMSSRMAGTGAENGGFQHTSGLTYDIDTSIESTVVINDQGEFVKVAGARRVNNIKVLNKKTNEYEPLNLKKTYTLASHNYMLKDGGDGLNMFVGDKILQDCVMKDYQVVMTYIRDYCNGVVPAEYSKPYGEGRISIEASKEEVKEEVKEAVKETNKIENVKKVIYTVKPGDYLRKIAKNLLGSESLWKKIYEANKALIKNPNMIQIGQELVIPQ